MSITREELFKWLSYDPDTGLFRWVEAKQKVRVGEVAGSIEKSYVRIRVCLKRYSAHRLAWLAMTGEWPESVDHINGIRSDNRWKNLRSVDTSTNLRNRAVRYNSNSGATGVNKYGERWRARISTDSGRLSLGIFETFHEAVAARKSAEEIHGYIDRK